MTKEETKTVKKQIRNLKIEQGMCFSNAQRLAIYSTLPLKYHEGTFGDIGMHAWCSYNGELTRKISKG